MHHPYRNLRRLPLCFSGIFLLFLLVVGAAPARADDMAQVLSQFTAVDPPREMVNLEFQDTKGAKHKLSDLQGHLVLVNLWATWCLPCRREMPSLDHLQTVYAKTKLLVVPVSLDDPNDLDKIKNFYQKEDIKSLPIYFNPDFPLLKQLHPDGLPTSYLLSPEGKIVGMIEGYASWDSDQSANLIETYLQKYDAPKGKK